MPVHRLSKHSWIQTLHPKEMPELDLDEIWDLRPDNRGQYLRRGGGELRLWHENYLKDYEYAGANHVGLDLPEELKELLRWVRTWTGENYNHMVLVWYENGYDYIRPHADCVEPRVGGSNILIISLGTPRTFRIRDLDGHIVLDLITEDGGCMIMGGRMQEEFTHEIVRVGGKRGENSGKRISINMGQFR